MDLLSDLPGVELHERGDRAPAGLRDELARERLPHPAGAPDHHGACRRQEAAQEEVDLAAAERGRGVAARRHREPVGTRAPVEEGPRDAPQRSAGRVQPQHEVVVLGPIHRSVAAGGLERRAP